MTPLPSLALRLRPSVLASLLAATLLAACGAGSAGSSTTTGGGGGGGGDDPPVDTGVPGCDEPPPATITIDLPVLGVPFDDEGQGWTRPPVWEHLPDATDDSITIPNGRPIYALIVSGYESNRYLDELMVYDFARHLQAQGAYVHWAWWNNLLAPYMERPLHHPQSFPGSLAANGLDFVSVADAGRKAAPAEDYQFVADATTMLARIREHNPSAMIVVVGHSMGGGAVVHLAGRTNVLIDLLAPIDPVGNRNYPWSGPLSLHGGSVVNRDYNWTRWRVSRQNFLGYRTLERDGIQCVPTGPWLKDVDETQNDPFCALLYHFHEAPTVEFGSRVVNLFHRYQQEALFPFDFPESYDFGHVPPPNGTSTQVAVPMTPAICGILPCADPGGWPPLTPTTFGCCATGDGVGWAFDGHGEIVGYRGPLPFPVPLGVRARTSPQCGSCPDLVWPARTLSGSAWSNGDGAARRALLEELEVLPEGAPWPHRPVNPALCLVSPDLAQLFDGMNRPPVAFAGEDQVLECAGPGGNEIVLDGSGSTDPESDGLEHFWTFPGGNATGAVVTVTLPRGQHCVTLAVRDPSGHVDEDEVGITIQDTTPPELAVAVTPTILWPPNHEMVEIEATVEAEDLCGSIVGLELLSIVSSDDDDGQGDGHTSDDVAEAEFGTLDTTFFVRAERAGMAGSRVYTITYRAVDDSENVRDIVSEVWVRNPSGH